MLMIPGIASRYCDGLSRRSFLQIGGLALGGVSLPEILRAEAQNGTQAPLKGIIMILLPGGPTHLDMYDLKPHAPAEIRGEFQPIRTNVPGIDICELMPRMAAIMDKLVVIRSLVGAINDHNIHQCVTGWSSHPSQPGSREVPGYPPGGYPAVGAVLSRVHGAAAAGVPPSVDLTPVYYDSRFVTSTFPGEAGYLGPAHQAFAVNAVERGNIILNGVNLRRLDDRRSLLSSFDRFRRTAEAGGLGEGMDESRRQAFALLTSQRLANALNLSREDARVRARYGIDGSPAARGGGGHLDQFLLARRLIEAGARCVTLVFSRYPFGRMSRGDFNWDWHRDIFRECRATLPLLDRGIAALVEDLHLRGLLDDIAVVAWGEFGRTPRINRNAGRDHWPQVSGALLAGGGIRGGQAVGATNRLGEHAHRRPVHFREVFATLYHLMGVDIDRAQFPDFAGRPHYLVDNRRPMPELV